MKKYNCKIFFLILIILMLLLISINNICLANSGSDFDPNEWEPANTNVPNRVIDTGNRIIGIITAIGIVIAVIVLAILGIKYMVGSPSDKSEYKKSMIPYLIGVFFLVSIIVFIQLFSKIIVGIF